MRVEEIAIHCVIFIANVAIYALLFKVWKYLNSKPLGFQTVLDDLAKDGMILLALTLNYNCGVSSYQQKTFCLTFHYLPSVRWWWKPAMKKTEGQIFANYHHTQHTTVDTYLVLNVQWLISYYPTFGPCLIFSSGLQESILARGLEMHNYNWQLDVNFGSVI